MSSAAKVRGVGVAERARRELEYVGRQHGRGEGAAARRSEPNEEEAAVSIITCYETRASASVHQPSVPACLLPCSLAASPHFTTSPAAIRDCPPPSRSGRSELELSNIGYVTLAQAQKHKPLTPPSSH